MTIPNEAVAADVGIIDLPEGGSGEEEVPSYCVSNDQACIDKFLEIA